MLTLSTQRLASRPACGSNAKPRCGWRKARPSCRPRQPDTCSCPWRCCAARPTSRRFSTLKAFVRIFARPQGTQRGLLLSGVFADQHGARLYRRNCRSGESVCLCSATLAGLEVPKFRAIKPQNRGVRRASPSHPARRRRAPSEFSRRHARGRQCSTAVATRAHQSAACSYGESDGREQVLRRPV